MTEIEEKLKFTRDFVNTYFATKFATLPKFQPSKNVEDIIRTHMPYVIYLAGTTYKTLPRIKEK